jgi:hypothetical protein
MRRLILVVVLGACGGGGKSAPPPAGDAIVLDTADGLSGLSVAADGALWTVAERARTAYRIVLDGDAVGSIEPIVIEGIPDELDLESIEAASDRVFLLGTEGNGTAAAQVWIADRTGDRLVARATPTAIDPATHVIDPNHGVEGICGTERTGAVALETVIDEGGRRLGQVDLLRDGVVTVQRVVMTSKTGKISGIDCEIAADRVEVLAIERHFETTRIIRFTLRGEAEPVAAELVRDLAELAKGRNFEGLARLSDGRIALVTDNQWKTIEGPSQLVILPPP